MANGLDLNPLALLREATKAVPAVRYATGLVGIAAAIFLVRSLLPGVSLVAMLPLLIGSIVCMAVLVIFAASLTAPRARRSTVAVAFLWSACLFVIAFMIFTVTAVAIGWPPAWAQIILPAGAVEKSLVEAAEAGKADPVARDAASGENVSAALNQDTSRPRDLRGRLQPAPSTLRGAASRPAEVPEKATSMPVPAQKVSSLQPMGDDFRYNIFFDYGRGHLEASGLSLIEKIAQLCRTYRPETLLIESHLDASEADGADILSSPAALEHQRLTAVTGSMQRLGCTASIDTRARAAGRPLVVTGSGVREPQNRRVSVTFLHRP